MKCPWTLYEGEVCFHMGDHLRCAFRPVGAEDADVQFVVHAHADVAYLLAALREAKALRDALLEELVDNIIKDDAAAKIVRAYYLDRARKKVGAVEEMNDACTET